MGLGFAFASLQNSDECRCDNKYGLYGKKPEVECSRACSGDPALTCGGVWRNTVYCLVPLYNKFLGCYKESVPRDLWGLETTATTNRCLKICQSSGYAYAAVQNDSRCTCGVSYGRYGKADPFTCNCTKDTNTVYETGGIWKMEELFYGNVQQSPPLARRHVIYKETSVDDLYLCMSYCEKNSLCKSINYNHMTRTCEMNNVTSLEGESQARQGFYYYEPVGKIFNHH
ncbi:hypothetical protein AC249_AIPGENE11023 [Exaiptasia diaphana]|nr:hypothetical protein AC249_AIPGENE11023 [Exaiptasia diaphana]